MVIGLVLVASSAPAAARTEALTMDAAVGAALARNREAIAARLEIEASELDVVAARIYPNPTLQAGVGNLVLGKANDQHTTPGTSAGFADQPVTAIGLAEIVDVWAKRSARVRAADRGVAHRRLVVEDALREIAFAVRSAFTDVVRGEGEHKLARDFAARTAETVRLSQARFRAGDISEAELRRIEIEALRSQNEVIDAETELDLARGRLAGLLALRSARELPGDLAVLEGARPVFDAGTLTAQAMEIRPDLRAAGAARQLADAEIDAARRDALPDLTLSATYTHSAFTVSGDNPNALGVGLSLPLPLFDRNQANIGRARLDARRAENEAERLRIAVAREVAEAVRRAARAATLLAVFERPTGGDVPGLPTGTSDRAGMLDRADTALRVAEKSYRAGAISLLELIEAQRTYLDTRARYLRAEHDFRQAAVDVRHAVGEP